MAADLSLTQRWLAKESARYPQRERVYADVDAALIAFDRLRPKTDAYTYDDGRVKHLLCVHGLLPITFRGAAYNIPIACWIPVEYPNEPPLVYVVPTGDMLIRDSNDVDVSGLCQFDYVRQWAAKPEGCSLLGLLRVMQDVFSRAPPVYSKPKSPTRGIVSAVLPQESRPRPTPHTPSNFQPPAPFTNPQPSGIPPDRPSLPPKPTRSPPVTPVSPPPSSHGIESSLSIRPTRPAPPHPSSSSTSPPQYVSLGNTDINFSPPQPPQTAGFVISFEPSRPPPPLPPPSALHPMATTNSVRFTPPPAPTISPPSMTPPQWAVVPMQVSSLMQAPPPQTQLPHASLTSVVRPVSSPPAAADPSRPTPAPRPPVPDLMDDDTYIPQLPPAPSALSEPPPRPPNPQLVALHNEVLARLNTATAHTTQTLTEDTQRLRAIQSDLLAGEPAIRDEMSRLEAVRDVCRAVANRTREWIAEVEALTAETKRRGEPEVDELVCSTTIVYNQLIDLVAEDNAIEDAIYHLHRALNAGRIDLDRFIKTTRELAEEQFMKRALIEKIEQGLPIGSRGQWV